MAARYNPPPNWPAPPVGWTPPPGWQPNPEWGPAPEGWQVWVEDAGSGAGTSVPVGAQASARPWFTKKRFIIPGAFLVLFIAIGALGGGGDGDDRTPTAGGTSTQDAQKDDEKDEKSDEKSDEELAAEAEAKNYLDTMPFSRAGLLAQLTSEYGGQFPAADAEFAVARLEAEGGVDWMAEAVEAYQETIPMSRQALIDQLTSEYGSQFTLDQATHAVDTLGL